MCDIAYYVWFSSYSNGYKQNIVQWQISFTDAGGNGSNQRNNQLNASRTVIIEVFGMNLQSD